VRKPAKRLPLEEKVRVVLAVLGGEMSASEAARRHGVSVSAVSSWRNRFLDAGRQSLADRVPGGPSRNGGSAEGADLPVSRFARLAGIPRRTYHRRLARLRDGEPVTDFDGDALAVEVNRFRQI
jgi:transposase